MKVRKLLAILMMICILAAGCAKNSEMVTICDENCFFSDFYEEDGIVHILCEVTLENAGNEDLTVTITGSSQEDVDGGLLTEPGLKGVDLDTGSEEFLIPAGQQVTVTVDFQGEFGGTLQKADRLIPDELEIQIVEK